MPEEQTQQVGGQAQQVGGQAQQVGGQAREPEPPIGTLTFATTAPEPDNAYQVIIDQQAQQINALIAQTQALNKQITDMIANGTQITDGAQHGMRQTTNINGGFGSMAGGSLANDEDYSLESLGKLIGKRE